MTSSSADNVWNIDTSVPTPPAPAHVPMSPIAKELVGGGFKSTLGRMSSTLLGSSQSCAQWRCIVWLVLILGLMVLILVLASANLNKSQVGLNWASIVLVALLMIGGVSQLAGVLAAQISSAVQKQCLMQEKGEIEGRRFCTAGVTQTAEVRDFFGEGIHCSDEIVIGASMEAHQDKCCSTAAMAKMVVDSVANNALKHDVPPYELLNGLLGSQYDEDEGNQIIANRDYSKVVLGITNICGNGGGVMQSVTLANILIANSDVECKHLMAAINESESTVTCIMGNGASTQKLQDPDAWQKRLDSPGEENNTITMVAIILMAVVLAVVGMALIILLSLRARRNRDTRESGQAILSVALDKVGNHALGVA